MRRVLRRRTGAAVYVGAVDGEVVSGEQGSGEAGMGSFLPARSATTRAEPGSPRRIGRPQVGNRILRAEDPEVSVAMDATVLPQDDYRTGADGGDGRPQTDLPRWDRSEPRQPRSGKR